MEITDLDRLVVLDSSAHADRLPSPNITGGQGQLTFFIAPTENLKKLDLQLIFDSLYSFRDRSSSIENELYRLEDFEIFNVSTSTREETNLRSVAGSGSLGNSRFSFAASSAGTGL